MAVGRIKRVLRWVLFLALAVFAGLQLRTVERTNPPVVTHIEAPTEITSILRKACYNCHSNETHWPWYSYVAPFSWWLEHHVIEGRRDLDFTRWNEYDADDQLDRIEEIVAQAEERKMPPESYLLIHSAARLDNEARATLRAWMETAQRVYSASSGS